MLYFLPFSDAELRELVQKQLQIWADKAKRRHSISLSWDVSVVDRIITEYDVHYGARSLQHAVDQLVVNQLAQEHERGNLTKGGGAHLSVKDDKITVALTQPEKKQGLWALIS